MNKNKEDLRALVAKLELMRKAVEEIQSEAAEKGIDHQIEESAIDSEMSKKNKQLTDIRSKIADIENKISILHPKIVSSEEKINILNHEIEKISKETVSLRSKMVPYRNRILELSVDDSSSFDELVSIKKDRDKLFSENRDLLSEVLTMENAINAAEASSELARLLSEQRSLEEELKVGNAQKFLITRWISFFEDLKKVLLDIKNSSVDEFTLKYGPLTSMIQSRLRTVYGFGEISLLSDKGSISVTVERNKNQLRPIDYFSESQKQILVLSLFFASAITQNWSSFAPIFLDDPVTHFDDLNAYAFLDLISGMLQAEKGQRQFVISTCEEKLFQLMKQKFYNFGGRVLIYEFTTIGEAGPVWRSVNNGDTAFEVEN